MTFLRAQTGTAPDTAMARPVAADPGLLDAYFRQVTSYEASERHRDRRMGRAGLVVGGIGAAIGVLGIAAVCALAPFKTVVPLVFRVDRTTGAVDRVYDVNGGRMEATEAETRFFLWQYVRLREEFSAPEAETNFDSVLLMSAPPVQQSYAEAFKGTNPQSPQVLLGHDGTATIRWISTAFLGPKLAQVRFTAQQTKAGVALPAQRMVATLTFDTAPGQLSATAMNVNPLGILVTSYRTDVEATP